MGAHYKRRKILSTAFVAKAQFTGNVNVGLEDADVPNPYHDADNLQLLTSITLIFRRIYNNFVWLTPKRPINVFLILLRHKFGYEQRKDPSPLG